MVSTAGELKSRRRARRAVMTAYYVVVVLFVLVAAGGVTWQVWSPRFRSYPSADCRSGLAGLAHAVQRARQAAANLPDATEDDALAEFRGELLPEWEGYDRVAASCRRQGRFSVALDAIERLRYSEERAVRRDNTELAPLRRKVGQILVNELEP